MRALAKNSKKRDLDLTVQYSTAPLQYRGWIPPWKILKYYDVSRNAAALMQFGRPAEDPRQPYLSGRVSCGRRQTCLQSGRRWPVEAGSLGRLGPYRATIRAQGSASQAQCLSLYSPIPCPNRTSVNTTPSQPFQVASRLYPGISLSLVFSE